MSKGSLYVVATPIGNLEDVTTRALETLGRVDAIAAEDTRHSRKLLERFGIEARLLPLHEHNESEQAPALVKRMLGGESLALISDAGTPLVSDPGYRLVQKAAVAGVRIVPIPGASAVTAALSVSALPTDRFVFEGFLPPKQSARRSRLAGLSTEARTLVFFESSHRILAALEDLSDTFGANRQAAVCRELTKQFETVLRGSLAELVECLREDSMQQKGEFVIVVSGYEAAPDESLTEAVDMARALLDYLPASQAAKVAAKLTGAPRRAIYDTIGR